MRAMSQNRGELAAAQARQYAAPEVNLAFLACQCMGDAVLQQEILALFLIEARRMRREFAVARLAAGALANAAGALADMAHKLKGSALAVGANLLAQDAERLENLCRSGAGIGERQTALARLDAALLRVCQALAPQG